MGCKTLWNYDISCLIVATHETSFTLRGGTYAMQNDMELRHSCLIVATHEMSFTLRGATCGMQNAMELQHSCLIVATHETALTLIARSNRSHLPTSPDTALAGPPRKMTFQNIRKIVSEFTTRGRSDHEPVSPQPARQLRLFFALATLLY